MDTLSKLYVVMMTAFALFLGRIDSATVKDIPANDARSLEKRSDHQQDSVVKDALVSLQEEKLKLLLKLEIMRDADPVVAQLMADLQEVGHGPDVGANEQGAQENGGKDINGGGHGQDAVGDNSNGYTGSGGGHGGGNRNGNNGNGNGVPDNGNVMDAEDLMKVVRNMADDVLKMRDLMDLLEGETGADAEVTAGGSKKRKRDVRNVAYKKNAGDANIADVTVGGREKRGAAEVNNVNHERRKRNLSTILKSLFELSRDAQNENAEYRSVSNVLGKSSLSLNDGHPMDRQNSHGLRPVPNRPLTNFTQESSRSQMDPNNSGLDRPASRDWHNTYCKGLIQYCGGFNFNCCATDPKYGVKLCCYWGQTSSLQDPKRRSSGICIPSLESSVTCDVN